MIGLSDVNEITEQTLWQGVNFSNHIRIPGYGLRKLRHPEIFQGNRKKKKYFEGWYFKMVSSGGSSILSVIPGIALSVDGKEQHAFIQIIDGKTAKTDYYSFPIEEFAFSKNKFAIKIGQNYFSEDKMILSLRTNSSHVSGKIHMSGQIKLASPKILNPGIMGWYRFVPFMQCYHGVVSLTHRLEGRLMKDGQTYDFNEGIGYIEKDWGSSMPLAWIWMQSNNFTKGDGSFMLSIANIPWVRKSFTGFLGFFFHDHTVHRFATYTRAKLTMETVGSDTLKISIQDRTNIYTVEAIGNISGLLKAPVKGSMDRRIAESINARLHLTVQDKKGNVIFNDTTIITGLEMVGDQKMLKDLLR